MSAVAGDRSNVGSLPLTPGCSLIVKGSTTSKLDLENNLQNLGYQVILCETGTQAIDLLDSADVDLVFSSLFLPDMRSSELVQQIKTQSSNDPIPVILLVTDANNEALYECRRAGGDGFIANEHTLAELNARIEAAQQLSELRHLYHSSVEEQVVARRILTSALSSKNADVSGMQVLSRSAGVFSGDLVLSAYMPDGGLNILLADFTGHGLSAAIGVLPVAEMFSVMTEKGFGPEIILKNMNSKLYKLLPTGMFMAACMVQVNTVVNTACVWNSGMPDVYLLDGNEGIVKQQISSTHIPLGINPEIDDTMEFHAFDIQSEDRFVLHSDGLTDATDSEGQMFGADRLEQILVGSPAAGVLNQIVCEFDRFCDNRQISDDVTVITFPCFEQGDSPQLEPGAAGAPVPASSGIGWRYMLEVSGEGLREINPVPIVLEQYRKLGRQEVNAETLSCVLSALYENALNHGVLELSQIIDCATAGREDYERERNRRFDTIAYGFIRIEIQQIRYQGRPSLKIRLEDSGRGFDHARVLSDSGGTFERGRSRCNGGIQLVRQLSQSLHYQGRGNRVEVIVRGNGVQDATA